MTVSWKPTRYRSPRGACIGYLLILLGMLVIIVANLLDESFLVPGQITGAVLGAIGIIVAIASGHGMNGPRAGASTSASASRSIPLVSVERESHVGSTTPAAAPTTVIFGDALALGWPTEAMRDGRLMILGSEEMTLGRLELLVPHIPEGTEALVIWAGARDAMSAADPGEIGSAAERLFTIIRSRQPRARVWVLSIPREIGERAPRGRAGVDAVSAEIERAALDAGFSWIRADDAPGAMPDPSDVRAMRAFRDRQRPVIRRVEDQILGQ